MVRERGGGGGGLECGLEGCGEGWWGGEGMRGEGVRGGVRGGGREGGVGGGRGGR